MKVFFFPSVLIALTVCLGIALQSHFNWDTQIIIISFILLIFLFLFFEKIKLKKLSSFSLLALWFTVGVLANFINNDLNKPNHYIKQHKQNENNEIILVINEKLKSSKANNRYIANIISINKKNSIGKVIVNKPIANKEILNVGDVLLTYNKLNTFNKKTNPYQFSYSDYLSRQNIFGQVYITKSNYKHIGTHKSINYYINKLRSNIINSFAIHNYTSNTQQFINAFLLGQRQELNNELNESYTHAGVVHILAISGLHVGILYGILLFTFKALRIGYKQRFFKLGITLLFLFGFALLTGLSPSVIRCVGMFSIVALAMTFNKNANTYNAMAVSLLIIAIIKPNIIFEVGFQLSYLAILCIVICNPLLKKLHVTSNTFINYVIDLLAISFLVQLFLLPLLLYYFNQFPTLFLLANLVVIPLSTFILYLLVILVFLNYLIPHLSLFLGSFIGWCISFLNEYVGWISSSKYAVIQNIPFNKLLFTASAITIIVIFALFFKRSFKNVFYLVFSILILNISFITTYVNEKSKNEFIVWDTNYITIVSHEENDVINIYTNKPDSVTYYSNAIKQHRLFKKVIVNKTPNYVVFNNSKIAIINSEKYYNNNIAADYLLLTESPKVNLERVIEVFNPKVIICDANNYKSYIENWEKTAIKKNIPFYSTYKTGYFSIEKN